MYARLPDGFAFDGRVIAAGDASFGLYCRMCAWAAGNGTDGFVPENVALMFSKRTLAALVEHGFIERVAQGEVRRVEHRVSGREAAEIVMPGDGIWLCDYLKDNATAAEGQAIVERARRAGRASVEARQAQRRVERDVEQQVEREVDLPFNRQVPSGPVLGKPLGYEGGDDDPDSPRAESESGSIEELEAEFAEVEL